MNQLLTYHGDPAIKAIYVARVRDHERQGRIVSGVYWEKGGNGDYHGCAVGCTLHEPGQPRMGGELHALYPELLGVPEWLAHLEDQVFEGLAAVERLSWPRRFLEAVPVGVSLDGLEDRLAVKRLQETVIPLGPSWPGSVRDEVLAAVNQVIDALEGAGDREAARSAAWSAEAAATAAAGRAAAAAAWSATAAEAAWSAEAARLLEELAKGAA